MIRAADSTKIIAFFHPDFTVGPGISPDPTHSALAGCTADRELSLAALTLPRRLAYSLVMYYTIFPLRLLAFLLIVQLLYVSRRDEYYPLGDICCPVPDSLKIVGAPK